MSSGWQRRLVEDRQAAQGRLAGKNTRRAARADGRTVSRRRPTVIRIVSRHVGLALVRAGRRLAGPDDLLDRRLALMAAAEGRHR